MQTLNSVHFSLAYLFSEIMTSNNFFFLLNFDQVFFNEFELLLTVFLLTIDMQCGRAEPFYSYHEEHLIGMRLCSLVCKNE